MPTIGCGRCPTAGEKAGVVALLRYCLAGTSTAFVVVRRLQPAPSPRSWTTLWPTPGRFRRSEQAGWEEVGFHRLWPAFCSCWPSGWCCSSCDLPAGGACTGILLPSAQALRGVWSLIVNFFQTPSGCCSTGGPAPPLSSYFAEYGEPISRRGAESSTASSLCGGRRPPVRLQLGVWPWSPPFCCPARPAPFYELLPGRPCPDPVSRLSGRVPVRLSRPAAAGL